MPFITSMFLVMKFLWDWQNKYKSKRWAWYHMDSNEMELMETESPNYYHTLQHKAVTKGSLIDP